jgi:Uma2 family endonuclease
MRVLTTDPPPQELEEVLTRRKALGQDGYDEVWEGDYHMAPMAPRWHGRVQHETQRVLDAPATEHGLIVTGPFNLGDGEQNFRVPDAGVHSAESEDTLYVPTALIVVEIVSPGDMTPDKFSFYWDHDVEEILTIDVLKMIRWWERRSDYRPTNRSDILGLSVQDLRAQIRWP